MIHHGPMGVNRYGQAVETRATLTKEKAQILIEALMNRFFSDKPVSHG